MSDVLPVVRVVSHEPGHEDGFVEINERDFDPEKHTLWKLSQSPADAKPKKRAPADA